MSYSIIFETKFLKLSDGRMVHFSRSGCNNDNSGRKKNEFEAEILTEDKFNEIYVKYLNIESNDEFALKVGSRWVSFKGYAEHLMRMYKRALSFEEFICKYRLIAECLVGIRVSEPVEKMMSPGEFDEQYDSLLEANGHIRYSRCIDYVLIDSESGLLELIGSNIPTSYEIVKKF